MILYENQCCDCATPAYPCRGESCPNRNVKVYVCDICGQETNTFYDYDGEQLCCDCLLEQFSIIE